MIDPPMMVGPRDGKVILPQIPGQASPSSNTGFRGIRGAVHRFHSGQLLVACHFALKSSARLHLYPFQLDELNVVCPLIFLSLSARRIKRGLSPDIQIFIGEIEKKGTGD
jgi:hypothetical protein